MNELKSLWKQFLGTVPDDGQWNLWTALHTWATIRHGVLKTAEKNMALHGSMSEDHKIRFASKVMNTRTNDPQKATGQRTPVNPPIAVGSQADHEA
jgi:hypothetical protein